MAKQSFLDEEFARQNGLVTGPNGQLSDPGVKLAGLSLNQIKDTGNGLKLEVGTPLTLPVEKPKQPVVRQTVAKQAKPQENVKASGLNTAVKMTSGTTAKRKATDPYKESKAVIAARNAMNQAQLNQPEYQQSQAVIDAQNTLAALQNAKPKDYESKYAPQLESILQGILNPGTFQYEFNGDNLFKAYADMYTQRGKQAMMDTMGQAAGLTGGYGNSYAQQVGQQAYDQNLTELYDRGMDLRDRAYQQWLDEQQNQYNQFNTVKGAEEMDYNRYRDAFNDWMNEREYATGRYDTERNYDYNQYRDAVADWENNRDYYTNRYDTERDTDYSRYQDARNFAEQQFQFDAELKEKIRQFDESLNWDKMSTQQKYAAETAMQVLGKGQMPSAAILKAAGLSTEDAKKIMTKRSSGGGGGGGGKKGGLIKDGIVYTDGKGGFKDENGKPVKLTDYDRDSITIVTGNNNNGNNNGLPFDDPALEKEFQEYMAIKEKEEQNQNKGKGK